MTNPWSKPCPTMNLHGPKHFDTAEGGFRETAQKMEINIDMKEAENFILREKQAENFMTEVVSQPTTITSKVVIIDYVVQYVAVESARAEVEDRFSAPLSLTRVSVTEVEDTDVIVDLNLSLKK